jgi:josephin
VSLYVSHDVTCCQSPSFDLQGEHNFTREELNSIADSLEDPLSKQPAHKAMEWWPFHSHHNAVTGNYDVNVLMAALARLGKEVTWVDKRKGIDSCDFATGEIDGAKPGTSSENKLVGFILNVRRNWVGIFPGRHWIAIRKIGGSWYNLDSDLKKPDEFLEGQEQLRMFLKEIWAQQGSELLIVTEDVGT